MVLETQAGISEGTVVLNITPAAPGDPTFDVEVSNTVQIAGGTLIDFANPAQLVVSSPVSVTLGDEINVYSSESPGIQFLSVYETEPVESLLDIFWETSTTGRIQEINDIITNENPTGTGAGGFSPWNDNVFTEGLRVGDDCLNAPVYLVDNFGATISSNDITSPVVLESAFNQQDPPVNVQTAFDFSGPVFSFEETSPGSYEYMLKAASGFVGEIYYGTDEGARNFTLTFSAEVNGLPISITQNMSLGNVQPHIPTASGNLSSFRPLFDQSGVDILKIIGGNPNIQVGDDVTTASFYPDQLPPGLTVSGNGFTPSFTPLPNPGFGFGVVNSVSDSFTVEFYSYLDLVVKVHEIITVATGSNGSIPGNTYVVSKGPIVDDKFTVTLSNDVTLNAYSVNQDKVLFTTPATIELSANVTVAENQLISAVNASEIWDDCPVGPIFPGGTDVRYVGELKAVNGAGWRPTDLLGNSQKNEDLTFTKGTETLGAGTLSAQETNYFSFENPGYASFAASAKIDIVNDGYQNANMPSGVYTIDYEVSDPGDSVQCQVVINTGLVICEIQEWTLNAVYRPYSVPYEGKFIFVKVCDPNGNGGYYYNENLVLQSRPVYNGWYGWRTDNQGGGDFPSWNSLISSNGSNNLIIDPYNGAPLYDPGFGWSSRFNRLETIQLPSSTYPFYGLKRTIQNNSITTGGDLWPSGNPAAGRPAPTWTLTAGTGTNTPLVPALENYVWSGTFQ